MAVALVASLVSPLHELDTHLESHVAAELMRSVRQKQLFSGVLITLQPIADARTYSEMSSKLHWIHDCAAQGRRSLNEVKSVMVTVSLWPLTAA